MACKHGCCGGYRGELVLTPPELELLRRLAQIPFLPVTRRADGETPVFLEDGADPEAFSAAILGLQQKQLIELDYDIPLENFDYQAYARYPCRGSIALTARGQTTVEFLEIQGIDA